MRWEKALTKERWSTNSNSNSTQFPLHILSLFYIPSSFFLLYSMLKLFVLLSEARVSSVKGKLRQKDCLCLPLFFSTTNYIFIRIKAVMFMSSFIQVIINYGLLLSQKVSSHSHSHTLSSSSSFFWVNVLLDKKRIISEFTHCMRK